MSIFAFLLLGLIAGAIAKAIMPGNDGNGWLSSLILGVIGAIVGGWLGSWLFDVDLQTFFDIQTWILAIGGALLVLVIWGAISGRSRRV